MLLPTFSSVSVPNMRSSVFVHLWRAWPQLESAKEAGIGDRLEGEYRATRKSHRPDYATGKVCGRVKTAIQWHTQLGRELPKERVATIGIHGRLKPAATAWHEDNKPIVDARTVLVGDLTNV